MRRRAQMGVIGAICAAGLIAASPVQAAIDSELSGSTLRIFSDTTEETNTVLLYIDEDFGLVAQDPEAHSAAGDCPQVASDTLSLASCLPPDGGTIRFELGGGSDRFEAFDPRLLFLQDAARIQIDAGSGSDVIQSVPQIFATLGTGADRARGALGADRISGGTGNDLIEGAANDDVLRGGPGRDRLYGGDKPAERDPFFGESDGRDKLFGNGGRDRLFARDFTKDKRLDCGPGNDRLRRDRFDPPAKSC